MLIQLYSLSCKLILVSSALCLLFPSSLIILFLILDGIIFFNPHRLSYLLSRFYFFAQSSIGHLANFKTSFSRSGLYSLIGTSILLSTLLQTIGVTSISSVQFSFSFHMSSKSSFHYNDCKVVHFSNKNFVFLNLIFEYCTKLENNFVGIEYFENSII